MEKELNKTRDELIKECVKYKHSNINIQQLLTAVEAYSSASNNGKPIVSGSLPDKIFALANELAINGHGEEAVKMHRIHNSLSGNDNDTTAQTDANTVLPAGWIPVEQLPTGSMKVKWLCEDGVEDVGFYYSEQKEFASWDLCSEKPITHWKPLDDGQSENEMTKQDLEKMGIIHLESKLYPNKFFVPQIGEVNLYEPYRWEDIFQKIYDSGYENGTKYGEAKKTSEIKRVLNIEDGQ